MRDVLLGNQRNTQEHKNLTGSGTGLESPFSDSALPCEPQLTETETETETETDLKQNVGRSQNSQLKLDHSSGHDQSCTVAQSLPHGRSHAHAHTRTHTTHAHAHTHAHHTRTHTHTTHTTHAHTRTPHTHTLTHSASELPFRVM